MISEIKKPEPGRQTTPYGTDGAIHHKVSDDRLHISVAEFCRRYGLGKTFTYALINAGELEVTKIGRRTLISVQSANELILQHRVSRVSLSY